MFITSTQSTVYHTLHATLVSRDRSRALVYL